MEEDLIAPCGMNCGLCVSYLAMKHDINRQGFQKTYCAGCLPRDKNCTHMRRHCALLANGLVRFCYLCEGFPCSRLKSLDRRYRAKYHMSMLDNLRSIQANGVEQFLDSERAKWTCVKCGGTVSCHIGLCLNCDLEKLIQNKKYCWDDR